jgi:Protein of unknown function (DUF4058)
MPLLDHFHPPIYPKWPWESFHSAWATEIMKALNSGLLPPGYLAFAQVHLGERIEVDVAAEEDRETISTNGPGGVAIQTWSPPAPTLTLPTRFPDSIEVRVIDTETGGKVAAAIELASPRNKDRPAARRAFAGKCAGLLMEGVGVVVVDLVNARGFNLHDELMHLIEAAEPSLFPPDTPIYAAAYKPTRAGSKHELDIWKFALQVETALPVVPLGLRGGPFIRLDLESTYSEARRASKL